MEDLPRTVEAASQAFREAWEVCASGFAAQGVDVTQYHMNHNADDLDALRRALGAERLTLWGISSGTHLALTVALPELKRNRPALGAGEELRPAGGQRRAQTLGLSIKSCASNA